MKKSIIILLVLGLPTFLVANGSGKKGDETKTTTTTTKKDTEGKEEKKTTKKVVEKKVVKKPQVKMVELDVKITYWHDPYPVTTSIFEMTDERGVTNKVEMSSNKKNHFFLKAKFLPGQYFVDFIAEVKSKGHKQRTIMPQGIRAKIVTINGQEITTEWLCVGDKRKTAYISLLLTKKGLKKGRIFGQKRLYKNVPPDCMFPVGHTRKAKPPKDFQAVVAWGQAVQDLRSVDDPSTVFIKTMVIKAQLSTGQIFVACRQKFRKRPPMAKWYGLYARYGWFCGDKITKMDTMFAGVMMFSPYKHPLRVYHYWTKRVPLPKGVVRVWLEVEEKAHGPVYRQYGLDAWRNTTIGYGGPDVNNTELAASGWYRSTGKWEKIVLNKKP